MIITEKHSTRCGNCDDCLAEDCDLAIEMLSDDIDPEIPSWLLVRAGSNA